MIVFEICEKRNKNESILGYLFYYERSKRFFAEILNETDEWTAPFMFSGHVKKGIYSIDSEWSGKFVRQRIIPPDRQNLGSILKDNNLKSYDELKLLLLSEGRCAQDELYLKRVSEKDILPEIKERLEHKVLEVMALGDSKVLVFFRDKESRIIDLQKLKGNDRAFANVLMDKEVFKNVRVSPGGNGIEWGEERFIPAELLRKKGKKSEIGFEDVKVFIKTRLYDTADLTEYLGCSRQYIKQMADKGKCAAVREASNTNLYFKSRFETETG